MDRTKYAQDLLTSGEIYATAALMLATDAWGTECLGWAPQTLRMELASEWGVEPAPITVDKLMAAITILTTDMFFRELPKFIALCNVLSDSEFNPSVFDPADALECAWGVSEAVLICPPEDDPEPFSDEIRAFIGHTLKDEGFIKPPDILRIALDADFTEQVQYGFSDDPALFSSVYAVQADKTEEVNECLRENLIELIRQLKSLPLKNGQTQDIEQRLQTMLAAQGREQLAT